MNIHTASSFMAQYANDPHPLEKFFVTFGDDEMSGMTCGREYLVTFNGADLTGYLGTDDDGFAFGFSAQLFGLRRRTSNLTATRVQTGNTAPQAAHADGLIRIPPPSEDYTHMGTWKGADSIEMSHGKEYNLIYESMSDTVSFMSDLSNWLSADGDMFNVTHDYGISPTKACARKAPRISPSGNRNGQHDDDCDMTGISITTRNDIGDLVAPKAEGCDAVFDASDFSSKDWTEDGDPVIAPGPASTEELREYRFKPNLF